MKLITDTCSVIKLLAFGTKLFQKGLIPLGDLVIHSRVFRETRKWPREKKEKYKKELGLLSKTRTTHKPLSVSQKDYQVQESIIKAVRDEHSFSVGSGDIEQLISALIHDHGIVTDDGHFKYLAEIMEIPSFDADDIVIKARDAGILNDQDITMAKKLWDKNGEKQSGKI